MNDSEKSTTDPITNSEVSKVIEQNSKKNNEKEAPEITEIIEALPEISKRKITTMLSATSISGRMTHPLFEKFTDEHISKFLDYIQEDDNNAHKYKSTNRIYILIYVILCLGCFFGLTFLLLPNNRDLLIEIIKLFVVFAGGLGSGFGIKSYIGNKN
jgi:hypothetical protein